MTHYLLDFGGSHDGMVEVPFTLRPRDMILVPSTTIARLDVYMDQYFTKFIAPPLDLALRGYFYLNPDRVERVQATRR
jgi:hypothetical protein